MEQALLVVLGAAVALVSGVVTEWLRQRWTAAETKRERAERQAERRREFQREHLVSLQEAMADAHRGAITIGSVWRRIEEFDAWQEHRRLSDSTMEAGVRASRHRALVEDRDVRESAQLLLALYAGCAGSETQQEYSGYAGRIVEPYTRLNERIRELVRGL